jgi:hypothetical protein
MRGRQTGSGGAGRQAHSVSKLEQNQAMQHLQDAGRDADRRAGRQAGRLPHVNAGLLTPFFT